MSEHDEQVALFNLLGLYERNYPVLQWIFAIPNGGDRHPAVARKMKAEGVKAGVWDILVPVPVDEKCGLWIEMKFGDGRLRESQKQFREDVGEAFEWAVCYSSIEAAHVIGDYLGITELSKVR